MDYVNRTDVSTKGTVELRFDDPDFLAALENDEMVKEGPERPSQPLARALGVDLATDFDFSYLVDANVCITVHAGRSGDKASGRADAARGNKDQFSFKEYQRLIFSDWVISVSSDDEALAPMDLSNRNGERQRAAFGALPEWLYNAYLARVRVHEDRAKLPPQRDPMRTAPKALADSRPSDTGLS